MSITSRGLRGAVLYTDANLIAINKWRNLPVQDHSNSKRSLLANLNLFKTISPSHSSDQPRLIHRLDQTTTGVLLIGRNPPVAGAISTLFEKGIVKKEYIGVCYDLRRKKHSNTNTGIWTSPHPTTGESMRTSFEILHQHNGFAIVKFQPHTGRIHQIRIHASENRLPVLGDKRYELEKNPTLKQLKKEASRAILRKKQGHGLLAHLHAHRLTIPFYFEDEDSGGGDDIEAVRSDNSNSDSDNSSDEGDAGGHDNDLVVCAPLPKHWHVTIETLFNATQENILSDLSCNKQ
eukprot:m.28727 g.28727  ORF g.28727 m.28727 type:complete len:291 (+) comp9497_c0_seq2:73-945(+)